MTAGRGTLRQLEGEDEGASGGAANSEEAGRVETKDGQTFHPQGNSRGSFRLTDTEDSSVAAEVEEGGEGMAPESGISGCKLLYVRWINKSPQDSTGNYMEYPVISHHGKEYEKESKCVYTWVTLLCRN